MTSTKFTADDTGMREAAFLEAHPEISAVVPSWADEVEFGLDGIEPPDGVVMFMMSREIGAVEIGVTGEWQDGCARLCPDLEDGGGFSLYIPEFNPSEPTQGALAAHARRVAADLLNVADVLDGHEEVPA